MFKKSIAILLVGSMLAGCATARNYTIEGYQPPQTGMTEGEKQGWALVGMIVVFGGLTALSYRECLKTTAHYTNQ